MGPTILTFRWLKDSILMNRIVGSETFVWLGSHLRIGEPKHLPQPDSFHLQNGLLFDENDLLSIILGKCIFVDKIDCNS